MVRELFDINGLADERASQDEVLVAAREEAPFEASLPTSRVMVQQIDSRAAAQRLLARSTYRLTRQAAWLAAARPAGGAIATIAVLLESRQLVMLRRRNTNPIAGGTPAREAAKFETPANAPTHAVATATSWIKFQVVHHVTGEPYVGVRLVVRTPTGTETPCRTNKNGLAALYDIDPGACDVWCPLTGARLAETAAFIEMGAPPTTTSSGIAGPARAGVLADWIAHIDEHRVQTGDTLKSIAEANSYSWQELAEFNWGTRKPDEINRRLRDDVGCSAKTADGMNYRFTSQDDPGVLYIPRTWSQNGLATERTHVIRVRVAAGFRLILENDSELRIPEAEYEARLADGSVRKGRLGRGGVSLIKDPPPGPVEVRYPDLDDIEAKSLAATARKALDERNPLEIHRLFRYPRETVQRTFAAYDAYFNDYHGGGLRNDLETEFFADPQAEVVFFGYLSDAGLLGEGESAVSSRDKEATRA